MLNLTRFSPYFALDQMESTSTAFTVVVLVLLFSFAEQGNDGKEIFLLYFYQIITLCLRNSVLLWCKCYFHDNTADIEEQFCTKLKLKKRKKKRFKKQQREPQQFTLVPGSRIRDRQGNILSNVTPA